VREITLGIAICKPRVMSELAHGHEEQGGFTLLVTEEAK
jgi:hypothetical protein